MAAARTRSRPSPRRLVAEGVLTEEDVEEMREPRPSADRAEAVEFADDSPEPALDSLYDHLYVVGEQVPRLVRGRRALARPAPRRGGARGGAARPRAGRARAPPTPGPERRAAGGEAEGDRPDAARDAPEDGGLDGRPDADARGARDAMAEEMRRDERVFVMGEDVGVFQGAFKVTEGLLDEFGEKRVRDTPISENTIVGIGVGAAMAGLRPGGRDHDRQLRAAGDGPDRQPRGGDPLHVRRPGPRADGDPDARRRRAPARPDPLAQPRGDVPPDPGPAGRLPLDRRPTARDC